MNASATVLAILALVCGLARPASAQSDMAGTWTATITEDNLEDAIIGFYIGIPMNKAAQKRTAAYQEALLTMPEWQCRPHGANYVMRSPQGRQWGVSKVFDPTTNQLIGYTTTFGMTIYLDGRPRPSAMAPHTWMGFSLGTFEGNILKFTTTHLKDGAPRRIGVPSSDQATLTNYWIRHGDVLTWITIHEDPVYLTEPMIRSMDYQLNPAVQVPAGPAGPGCVVVEEIGAREATDVPHILPGENKYLGEYGAKYGLPMEITQGGAATMYPEAARALIEQANVRRTR